MTPPVLPLEVFDEIVSQSADEISILKSCSLVCRSFRRSAQKMLFNCIVVKLANRDSDESPINLVLIVEEAPHLIDYIQELQISYKRINRDDYHDEDYIHMLANALDDTPRVALQDALVLLMTLHSLRDIALDNCFYSPANLVPNLPPLLKHLSLDRVEFSSLPTRRDELPKLESLTLDILGVSFPSDLVERIVDISQVKTFQGGGCNPYTMPVIERILRATSNSLEHLTLQEFDIDDPDSISIDLNRFSRLTDITITQWCYVGSYISLIPPMLILITKMMKTISPQNVIQNLSFHLKLGRAIHILDFDWTMKDVWQELDTIWSIPQLASSKSFHGITFIVESTPANCDAFSDLVQNKLPETKKASKLHVKTSPFR
ncbi:hypothetical protein M378DRAFT_17240 [Amanita muscaria Koide BX008]|uniref:F-box domain-containing protein n=1 Tax=Amanita muscaria (strain Koide BX008) TaxID=946122 RepID=A0A0C2S0U4_AMAMK|nr:hypothetical protein M378DRAFT_17240 [Amanita muscaria Koide BX008]